MSTSDPHGEIARLRGEVLALEKEIGERVQVEAELRLHQEMLSRFLETSTIGLHWEGEDGTILWANEAASGMLGFARDEFVGRNIREFHVDGPVIEDFLSRLLRDERLKDFEARLRCKDGTVRTVLIDSSAMWRDGKFLHTQCFTRDISGQKKSEIESRRLAAIVESSYDGIISKDLNGIITSWNSTAERIFGYAAEEVIGKHITILFPPDQLDEEAGILERISRGESLMHYEAIRMRKDGSLVPLSLAISPIKDSSGRIIGASKIVRDITERRRFEAALVESERRFRMMADSAPVFIWMAGRDGGCEYVNRPWQEFTGRDPEQDYGTGWAENIHADDRKKALEAFTSAIRLGADWRMEFRLRRRDGAYRWVLSTGVPRRSSDGSLLGYISSCVDVSESKRAEELLHQSQKMEAIGRLAGGIAHDFNNLLTAINGYSELAIALESGDEALPEFLAEIRKSGERAAGLTQQLLAYGRRQMVSPKNFDLNVVVAGMDRMLRRLIGEDIEFRTHLDPGIPKIKADPGQVEQVIMNIVLNARDAMPRGGRLLVETHAVVLPKDGAPSDLETASGPFVQLVVRDTGVGMSEETKSRIFEPFFTTKDVGKGTGLGLASTYGFVKQTGGGISVESRPGAGATFTVYLPIAQAEPAVEPPVPTEAGPAVGGSKATILVAEDEEAVRKLISISLAGQGYAILEASDGEEALEIALAGRPIDMLVTDVIMPKLNGADLAERLRHGFPDLKTLFISGYTKNIVQSDDFCDPASDFMQKPFTPKELIQRVVKLLERGTLEEARSSPDGGAP